MITRTLRALGGNRAGGSAVEFALVLGPLLGLVFGITEYGRLLWTREALQQTATLTARCSGILQASCTTGNAFDSSKATTYAQQIGSNWGLSIPAGNVTVTKNATCGGVTNFSSATITRTFTTPIPQIAWFGGPNMQIMSAGGVSLSVSACFPNSN
jgi:Flp pilus assembly protein TadG